MRRRHHRLLAAATALGAAGLLLAGCATSPGSADAEAQAPETPAVEGRLAVAFENGLAVLDPETLEIVGEFETEEFTRLNAAGDGRHVLVTTSEGFQVLDTAAPELTDLVFEADTAGHVVRHGGKTVLYADGTSETTIFETHALADAKGELPETQTHRAEAAHHGVSIVLEDGTLLTTVGDADGRTGAMALEPHEDHWDELAVSDQCPGIHGEGTAQDEVVVFGCENGALLYKDGEFVKLQAPAEYGRMGNAYVSESSPIVVGDYKDDPDAEGYLLHAVTLIDTAAETYEVVELPIEYTFRDVARGPEDRAYILATDGSIHVLDPATGELVDEFPVIERWEGPAEWQDPHPAIVVNGDIAYVTEPAANSVHAVDLTTGEVVASTQLDEAPNEMAVALG
ncbi:zinc metallochaperone AztD [Microbacterium sp. Marseille-Q6965]|uniref:zinc metallochaperone AztD n=1 Tax=Microbacterium sp. Marseille-Q6965 TaxID=2965072 RepID=UPI0021B74F73|nr:zinc metallochaperone AztD [Microbacterium sp. Marseille-Q6965]